MDWCTNATHLTLCLWDNVSIGEFLWATLPHQIVQHKFKTSIHLLFSSHVASTCSMSKMLGGGGFAGTTALPCRSAQEYLLGLLWSSYGGYGVS